MACIMQSCVNYPMSLYEFAKNSVAILFQLGGKAVHQFGKLGFTQKLPFTERLFERLLMLPMNMSLADDDVDYVCRMIRRFYEYE